MRSMQNLNFKLVNGLPQHAAAALSSARQLPPASGSRQGTGASKPAVKAKLTREKAGLLPLRTALHCQQHAHRDRTLLAIRCVRTAPGCPALACQRTAGMTRMPRSWPANTDDRTPPTRARGRTSCPLARPFAEGASPGSLSYVPASAVLPLALTERQSDSPAAATSERAQCPKRFSSFSSAALIPLLHIRHHPLNVPTGRVPRLRPWNCPALRSLDSLAPTGAQLRPAKPSVHWIDKSQCLQNDPDNVTPLREADPT
jgi:hypothetical protein